MAEVMIKAGTVADIPNRAEMAEDIRSAWTEQEAQHERYRARGVKLLRRDFALTTPAQTRLTANDAITPEQGYMWCVLLVAAQLASSSSFQAFITSDTNTAATAAQQRRLVASTSSNNQYPALAIPKNACILQPGEGLFLNAGANIQSYFVAGWEVIAEMAWKLL